MAYSLIWSGTRDHNFFWRLFFYQVLYCRPTYEKYSAVVREFVLLLVSCLIWTHDHLFWDIFYVFYQDFYCTSRVNMMVRSRTRVTSLLFLFDLLSVAKCFVRFMKDFIFYYMQFFVSYSSNWIYLIFWWFSCFLLSLAWSWFSVPCST